jgi:hypothetical protein
MNQASGLCSCAAAAAAAGGVRDHCGTINESKLCQGKMDARLQFELQGVLGGLGGDRTSLNHCVGLNRKLSRKLAPLLNAPADALGETAVNMLYGFTGPIHSGKDSVFEYNRTFVVRSSTR